MKIIEAYKVRECVSTSDLLTRLGLASSSYYYQPREGKPGRKPSTCTLHNGQWVENTQVIKEIKTIISGPYNAYGYQNVTEELRDKNYWINEKKVYRLMDENKLLLGKVIRTKGRREWVQFRKIQASRPMEYLCLDIKFVWVHGEGRWYYQLSVMDVYSRKIIIWMFEPSIKKKDVIEMFRKLHLIYNLKGVIIRNDNGSQFLANEVRAALKMMEARQEFTHVATPEENAYIESFHSIQERELFSRYEFLSYYEAKEHIRNYMEWYNYSRKHKNLGRITPHQKWEQGILTSTVKPPEQADGKDRSRPVDAIEKTITHQPPSSSLDLSGPDAYLCLTGDRMEANHF